MKFRGLKGGRGRAKHDGREENFDVNFCFLANRRSLKFLLGLFNRLYIFLHISRANGEEFVSPDIYRGTSLLRLNFYVLGTV